MRVEFKCINKLIIIGDIVDEHDKKNVWFVVIRLQLHRSRIDLCFCGMTSAGVLA